MLAYEIDISWPPTHVLSFDQVRECQVGDDSNGSVGLECCRPPSFIWCGRSGAATMGQLHLPIMARVWRICYVSLLRKSLFWNPKNHPFNVMDFWPIFGFLFSRKTASKRWHQQYIVDTGWRGHGNVRLGWASCINLWNWPSRSCTDDNRPILWMMFYV
jgi:hypothetical protein